MSLRQEEDQRGGGGEGRRFGQRGVCAHAGTSSALSPSSPRPVLLMFCLLRMVMCQATTVPLHPGLPLLKTRLAVPHPYALETDVCFPLPSPPLPPQVTFHDTARMRKRVPLLSDFFGFTCGALGEKVRLAFFYKFACAAAAPPHATSVPKWVAIRFSASPCALSSNVDSQLPLRQLTINPSASLPQHTCRAPSTPPAPTPTARPRLCTAHTRAGPPTPTGPSPCPVSRFISGVVL